MNSTDRRAHNFDNKIGKKYGDLVVLNLAGVKTNTKGKRKALWECICICGNKIIVIAGNLASGNTTNCGCERTKRLQFYVDTKLRLPKGEAAFNSIYSKYKYEALNRNLKFEISKEVFRELCTGNCFYCGCAPKNIEPAYNKNGHFVYSGIDRVNNTKGYLVDNCVSCCKICNSMKHTLTKKEFINHVRSIYKNMENKNK